MKRLKFKLLNWLIHSLGIKFVGFTTDKNNELNLIANVPITDFKKIIDLVAEYQNKK
jgi:hypothetical protein